MGDVRVVDRGEGKLDLSVEVYENPDAIVFKGTTRQSLRAWVCGDCGYTELFVEDPGLLLEAHRAARRKAHALSAEGVASKGRLTVDPDRDSGSLSVTSGGGELSEGED